MVRLAGRMRVIAMPLPQMKPAESDVAPSSGGDAHYFGAAHGDVAALHNLIERGFGTAGLLSPSHSQTNDWVENGIRLLSRGAGVAGFLGALAYVGYILI